MSKMLQELLTHFEKPSKIYARVYGCKQLMRRLQPEDCRKIYNSGNKGYNDFDIPLIYTILRNLHSNIKPSRGWDHPTNPQKHEILLGDDLERCRRSRNDILHRGNTTVTDAELEKVFTDFKLIAKRMEDLLGKSQNEFVSKFENLQTCCMDEETQKMYLDNLDVLKESENNTRESIQALEENRTRTEERMSLVEQDMQSLKGNIT